MSQTMSAPPASERIRSVDLLRGLVMIIMAIDHVRDVFTPMGGFSPEDLEDPGLGLFMTRWITHFCAPVFVFLCGTSAWLYQQNTGCSRADLQKFLLSRGAWLIVVEFLILNTAWLSYMGNFIFVQVIWAIGWSMIALALVLPLGLRGIAALGLVMIFGHNLLDGISPEAFGSFALLWNFLHVQGGYPFGDGWYFMVVYPLIPWLGVIMVGYAFGSWLSSRPREDWQKMVFRTGAICLFLFLLLRVTGFYGDPQPWVNHDSSSRSFISFLNTEKYPPSLSYLLMTMGPALMLMPFLEGWRSKIAEFVTVFGRVPFFYYVLHIPLIHGLGIIYSLVRYDSALWWFGPPQGYPAGYEPQLWMTYLVTAIVVTILYFPSRWYAALKRRRKDWWLSYL